MATTGAGIQNCLSLTSTDPLWHRMPSLVTLRRLSLSMHMTNSERGERRVQVLHSPQFLATSVTLLNEVITQLGRVDILEIWLSLYRSASHAASAPGWPSPPAASS
jgi:hypothetical protein